MVLCVLVSAFRLSELPSSLQLFMVEVESCQSGPMGIVVVADEGATFTTGVAEE